MEHNSTQIFSWVRLNARVHFTPAGRKYNIYNEEGILVACDEDSILELLAENGYEIKIKKEKTESEE